jgi:hypothetical protein
MGRQEKGATSKHRTYYQRYTPHVYQDSVVNIADPSCIHCRHKEELRAKSRKRMALKRLAEYVYYF